MGTRKEKKENLISRPAWQILTRLMFRYYEKTYGDQNQFNIKLVGVSEKEIQEFENSASRERELWTGFKYGGYWWGPVEGVEREDKDEYCMICVIRKGY